MFVLKTHRHLAFKFLGDVYSESSATSQIVVRGIDVRGTTAGQRLGTGFQFAQEILQGGNVTTEPRFYECLFYELDKPVEFLGQVYGLVFQDCTVRYTNYGVFFSGSVSNMHVFRGSRFIQVDLLLFMAHRFKDATLSLAGLKETLGSVFTFQVEVAGRRVSILL